LNNPRRNAEGYADPTAYQGMQVVVREESEIDMRVHNLIKVVKFIIRQCGFELVGRIHLKDIKTGKMYK